MKPNQHLREIALLGHSKKGLDINQLPKPIATILESKTYANKEDKVLAALSLQYYFNEAGTLPQVYPGEINVQPIAEEKDVIDDELTDIFKQIIALENIGKERLLNTWLDTVNRKSQIIIPSQIVPILKFSKACSAKTKAKILSVIGEKGRWVMKQTGPFVLVDLDGVEQEMDHSKVWTEGDASARRTYFEELRSANKIAAIELLSSTWTEESIRDKVAFLKIIKSTYDESDVPFLEKLYNAEFKFKVKEKKLVLTCRRIIAETLLSIPTAELHVQAVEELTKYTKKGKSKGLLSKVFSKSKVIFNFPEKSDDFWNAQVMLEKYGFDDNPDIAQFKTDSLYWFSCFVQAIPFDSWKKILDTDRKATVDFFLNHPHFQNIISGKEESNLQNALIEQANNHRNQELILLLLNSVARFDNVTLLQLLKPENWEKYLIKHDLMYTSYVLNSCNLEEGKEWSKTFTDAFVKGITKKLHDRKVAMDYQIGVTASNYFNVDSLALLKKINETEANMFQQYNWWYKHFYGRIIETTAIRSLLKNYK